MLGDMIVPTSGSAGLVSNTVGADFGQPFSCPTVIYDFTPPAGIKPQDGDAILQTGPTDIPETWVYGPCGWSPGTTYKRIILDRRIAVIPNQYDETRKKLGLDPITGLPVVDFSTGGINAGNLALIGLLGFLLLRGAVK
jgi:hypothetical protein